MSQSKKKYDYTRMDVSDNNNTIIINYSERFKCESNGQLDHCDYRYEDKTDTFPKPTTDAEKATIFDRLFELNTATL